MCARRPSPRAFCICDAPAFVSVRSSASPIQPAAIARAQQTTPRTANRSLSSRAALVRACSLLSLRRQQPEPFQPSRRTEMPFPYSNPDQLRFPGDLWPRDGSWDPNLANTPFSLSPQLPSATDQIPEGDSGGLGDDSPVVQAQFLRDAAARAAGAAARGSSAAPAISTPGTAAWWWDHTKRGHQGLANFLSGLLRRDDADESAGLGGSFDARRCMRAAYGTPEEWDEFCRSLSDKAKRGRCFNKTNETPINRWNWCNYEFDD